MFEIGFCLIEHNITILLICVRSTSEKLTSSFLFVFTNKFRIKSLSSENSFASVHDSQVHLLNYFQEILLLSCCNKLTAIY